MAIRQIAPPNFHRPFVENDGSITEQSRTWADEVTLSIPIIGTGSPEGVVEARQRQKYMDETGVAGSVSYIKQRNDILGDRTMGWVLG